MKKLFTICSLAIALVSYSNMANAQETGQFNLSVDLSTDVFSITMGADRDVAFEYATAADYTAAKTINKNGHFTVVSNRPYNVSIAANSDFATTGTGATLPLSVVSATVDETTENSGTTGTVPLAISAAPLVAGAPATVGTVFNVDFTITSPALLLPLQGEVYNTDVTYTVTQP